MCDDLSPSVDPDPPPLFIVVWAAQARPLSAPVLTFVSNIKNVPAQNISGRHIYLNPEEYIVDAFGVNHNKK